MTSQPAGIDIPLNNEQMADMLFAASQEVFTSMLGSEVTRLPTVETKDPFDGVFSLVGLAGSMIGNGGLVCSAESARDLSAKLLFQEYDRVDEEVLDAVGEITNMIVGGFKNLMEPYSGQLQMSIPTVIFGKNIATRNSKADVTLSVHCAFPGGEFILTIRLAAARD